MIFGIATQATGAAARSDAKQQCGRCRLIPEQSDKCVGGAGGVPDGAGRGPPASRRARQKAQRTASSRPGAPVLACRAAQTPTSAGLSRVAAARPPPDRARQANRGGDAKWNLRARRKGDTPPAACRLLAPVSPPSQRPCRTLCGRLRTDQVAAATETRHGPWELRPGRDPPSSRPPAPDIAPPPQQPPAV
ncbi:sterile alpha motif domain-containing protein 1-like [Schistocerca gregaria]|uniref:sterile alpha motif domain-containing protein 1-like n=1 Tax=Schistocerca gregaria TaxID=7010 RepID=UPI00211E8BAD|nr:sterile alpha motif domain-containing protein 1-like [Schistocerca gregaria]